jgi:hypothetical protein
MSPLSENRRWDLETDLLVIGAGAAGMTAALVGALEKTIRCEKSDMVGSTTATSAGTFWIPGSRQSEAAGVPDSIASAKAYLAAILGEDAGDARLAAFHATRRPVFPGLPLNKTCRGHAKIDDPNPVWPCNELPSAKLIVVGS